MSVMIIHIVVSIVIAAAFLGAFIWAMRSGQYDDDYSPSVRILFDDASATSAENPAPINMNKKTTEKE